MSDLNSLESLQSESCKESGKYAASCSHCRGPPITYHPLFLHKKKLSSREIGKLKEGMNIMISTNQSAESWRIATNESAPLLWRSRRRQRAHAKVHAKCDISVRLPNYPVKTEEGKKFANLFCNLSPTTTTHLAIICVGRVLDCSFAQFYHRTLTEFE